MNKDLEAAVENFRKAWAAKHIADDVGPALTCQELDDIAFLFEAAGDPATAQLWRDGHMNDCDEHDRHRELGR